MSDATQIVSRLTEWIAAGGSLLVLTDYDGTLTPLVDDPAEAWLEGAARDRLRGLARSPRARVGVISGRDLEDLRARVAVPEAICAGCHGLDIEGPGIRFRHPEAAALQEALERVVRALSLRAGLVPGMRVEPKLLSAAVHYRQVPAGAVPRVEAEVARALGGAAGPFTLLHGNKVIEILPRVEWSKGECALWIRDRVIPALPPPLATLYLGDDRTDEDAFRALAGWGLTVRVGPEEQATQAAYRLGAPPEVHALLGALETRLGSGGGR